MTIIIIYFYSMSQYNMHRCWKDRNKDHDQILKNFGPDKRLGKCRYPRCDQKHGTEHVYVEIGF